MNIEPLKSPESPATPTEQSDKTEPATAEQPAGSTGLASEAVEKPTSEAEAAPTAEPVETPKAVAEALATMKESPVSTPAESESPAPSMASIYPAQVVSGDFAPVGDSGIGSKTAFEERAEAENSMAMSQIAAGVSGLSVVLATLCALLVQNFYIALTSAFMFAGGSLALSVKALRQKPGQNLWAMAGFVLSLVVLAGVLFVLTYYLYFRFRLRQLGNNSSFL